MHRDGIGISHPGLLGQPAEEAPNRREISQRARIHRVIALSRLEHRLYHGAARVRRAAVPLVQHIEYRKQRLARREVKLLDRRLPAAGKGQPAPVEECQRKRVL